MEVQKTTPTKTYEQEFKGNPLTIIYAVLAIGVSCFLSFNTDMGFFGKLFLAVLMSILGFIGVLLGDLFRKFFCPDFILTSGLGNMIYQKLFWLAGPQIVGYLGGMAATMWLFSLAGIRF